MRIQTSMSFQLLFSARARSAWIALSRRRANDSGLLEVCGGDFDGGEEDEEGESKAEEWKRLEAWEEGREVKGELCNEVNKEERGGSEVGSRSRRGRWAERPASSCWKLGWKRDGCGGRKGGRRAGGRDGRKDGRGGRPAPGFNGEVRELDEEGGSRWEEVKESRGLLPAAAIRESAE